ncbi:ABC transporter substrate-binding protein [Streptomyces sp. NPDC005931]|uniref:ABC transporter substrate-binding protein n=1 Tax=Streptomyces sp. NPDC005931 TaxID=3364737 RepID=UPI0036CA9CFC
MTRRRTTLVTTTCIGLSLALGATACGSPATGDSGNDLAGRSVTVAGVWSGSEQKNFQNVLDAFTDRTGVRTRFVSTGDDVSTFVGGSIRDGNAPDVVLVPQVGALKQFAEKGWITPLSELTQQSVDANYADIWGHYGSVDDILYGLYFKATYKSTVWYSPEALDKTGAQPPATFEQMLTLARTLSDSGLAPFSVAGQDGWTLTGWFENIYLSQAGPARYDALAAHEIKWTDPTVVEALTTLGELFEDEELIAGGPEGALRTDFPESVEKVFGPRPEAAMVYEGDFVAGIAKNQFGKQIGQEAAFFPFPAVDGRAEPVVSGGDAAVVLKDGKDPEAAMALVEYLATPEAATVWAEAGGFLSPNRRVPMSAYPDVVTTSIAASLVDAGDLVRFDMSDQAPAAFGGTEGAGEWKILQDFLRDPSDPEKTAAELEAAAAEAYGN